MTRVTVDGNRKGAIGEAVILGSNSLPGPVSDELVRFLGSLHSMGDNPNPWTKIRRDVYFNATTEEGESVAWKADGRITVRWSSPEVQNANTESKEYQPRNMEAVFPVDIKTGEYAELERHQLDVARAIATTPNNVFPTVINVSVEELPKAFDVTTKIFGRDSN